jgi:hypothetical protein
VPEPLQVPLQQSLPVLQVLPSAVQEVVDVQERNIPPMPLQIRPGQQSPLTVQLPLWATQVPPASWVSTPGPPSGALMLHSPTSTKLDRTELHCASVRACWCSAMQVFCWPEFRTEVQQAIRSRQPGPSLPSKGWQPVARVTARPRQATRIDQERTGLDFRWAGTRFLHTRQPGRLVNSFRGRR